MLKTPQQYWKEMSDAFPAEFFEIGLDFPMRMAFYLGINCMVDFMESLATVENRTEAYADFISELDHQRIVEMDLSRQRSERKTQ
jgi:hypothetical protein